jgi:hypothetical protein
MTEKINKLDIYHLILLHYYRDGANFETINKFLIENNLSEYIIKWEQNIRRCCISIDDTNYSNLSNIIKFKHKNKLYFSDIVYFNKHENYLDNLHNNFFKNSIIIPTISDVKNTKKIKLSEKILKITKTKFTYQSTYKKM